MLVEYTGTWSGNINNASYGDITINVTGDDYIQMFELVNFSSPANAAAAPLQIYLNNVLIYTVPSIPSFGSGAWYIQVVDFFTGKKEKNGDTYTIRINNNSGNNWNYTFYVRRRVIPA